jgi:flavin reductase (DIM6/NTAB) family NADH-FMN oxidoreductase RutF
MSRINWKGSVLIAPVPPTMVTCSFEGKDNVFTVAWTGVLNTQPPKTYISVRPTRYSYELIKNSGEFVINLTTTDMVRAADWCGTYTGRKVDKFAKHNLEKIKAEHVSAPILAQSPVALECKVCEVVSLGTHDMFIADIVGVQVATALMDRKGAVDMRKADLVAYNHGEYYSLGKILGFFGYSIAGKEVLKRRKRT